MMMEPPLVCAQVKVARVKRYSPDFSKAFQHIAVHPGARVIIDRVAGVRAESAHAAILWLITPRSRASNTFFSPFKDPH